MAATQDNIAPPPPRGFSPYVDTTPPPPRGFTPYVEEKDAPTVTRQTVSQGPAPLAPGVSTIDDGRPLIGRETAAPPPNVAASTRTINEGAPTAEEIAIASQPYRGPIIRRRPAPVAPVVNKPEPKEPLIYKTRVEALDDAVNLLEMNQNLADVVKHFASLGVTQDEIESHAKARNSEYVQPRVPTAPSGRYSLTNAKLQKTPSVADEIARLYSEGKPGEALKLAAQDEIKTYAKVFKTAGANLGDQATSALTTIGAMTPEEASFRIRENATARARNAPSDAVQKGMMEIKDAKTYGAVVEKMWEHPVATITMMADSVLTSLPTLAPALLLGPAGAGVRAAAALVGSGTSEYASTMTDVLQDQKIDLRDVEQVAKALRDPKILAEIKDKGLKRGLIVGVFDGITMGLAGRFLSPVRELIREGNLAGNAARKATIGAWSNELALQVIGSGSGEVLAQKAVGEDKKAAVVLEVLASLPTSPLEVMSTFRKGPTPGETIGNALREQVARGSFTEEGIQNEVRNSLDPGRQQASNIPNRPTLEVPTKQFGSPVAKNEIPPEQPPEQKSTQAPVTSLNKEDEYVNEEDLFAPPANVEAPVVANFADRATTAADKFESAVVEQFGLPQEQAKAALATLMYLDAVKLDPLSGQFTLTNGQFWDKEIMLKAAETGANLPKAPAVTTTAAPILEAPAPQKTIAEILGGTNQEAAPAAEIKEEVPAADTPVTPTEEPSITEVAPPAAPSEQHKLEAIPTVYPLVSKLTLSQDVPQFKGNANASGVVKPLGGLFNTTGLAPIQVWRRLNGDLEVISGRHRLDLAKRSGVVTIPSQIHNEADGFTKKHASILDAELNIQDEQGEVKDYVNYFQGSGISKEDANSRGLLARTKGERGFAIANEGSAELIAAHRADAFGDEAAFLITKNAPNNGKLQAVGIKALLENKTIATAVNTMQAVRAISGSNQGSTDMFGFDDSAMKEAEQMASIVAKKQREIATRLSAISGAAKNPAIAKAEGIDIRDQDAVSNRISELKQQKMAWDKWFENPEILAEVRQGLGNSPLQLQGETSADIQAKEKKQKAAAVEAGAEAKRIDEKEKAETERNEIAARSDGQVLELTPSEQVDTKTQEEIDKKEAETKLAGQKDIFDDGQQSMAGSVGATTKEQKDMASLHAANMGAEVVWQQGVYSLIRGYAPLSGDPLYMPTFGSLRIQRDISAVQDTRIPNDIKQKMLDAKAKSEAAADKLHKTKPFIKFDAGIATSENVSPELAGVLREWKNFLNIQSDIYISTLEDATKNRNKFTGPHRRVGSGTLNKRNFGSMRQMADGSYYILFTDSTSITKMLETIAHELGHIHEKTHFNNASPQERTALFDEHKNWLSQQKGKTAEDLVKSLRPRSIGRATTVPSEMMADTITNPLYWKSFGEWYADQTAKWAVSSKAPVGIVEKYFKRLGQALRIFFQTLKAQKYLPTETFSKYMEAVTNRPANLQPAVSDSEAQSMKADEDIVKKYNRAEVPDTNNDTIKETVLKAVQQTKDVVIEATLHPRTTATSALVGMDRALLGARNREVFFGAALNAADIARYGGQLRTSAGLATASLALDNAIRGNIIATQVIFQGGLVYDSKTMTYRAEKTKLGMHGVYREEAKLKKKLGKKLGMQIIQGYLEAKRSQSILDELEARELEVQMQRQAVAAMTNKAGVTPAVLAKATANLQDAEAGLTAIKRVEKKINMSPDQITEFLDREKDHPELRNIMDNFNAINQNLLSFWLDVGLLSKGRYEVLSKIQDYVPWHRIMEDDVNPENTEPTSPMLSSTRSMTNIGREKIMRDGKPEVKKTFKVKIGQRIFKVKPSSDVFVEINGQALPSGAYRFTSDGTVTINSLIPLAVGDRVVITTNREIENMIDNMTRSVMRMTLNGVRQQAARRTVSEYADRDEKDRIIVYPKAERTKTSNRFSYIANGKPIIVGIEDKLISDAIYGLDTISLTSSNLMSAASNFIRRSITLSGVFQLKQVIKDAPSAAMVIKPKSPFLLIGGVYKGFVTATLRPIVNSVGKKFNSNFDIEPVVEVLLKNGIGGFHNAARTPEKEIKINLGIMNNTVAGYVFKFLDHIGDSSDVAQRVAVYKRVLKETGDETQALFHAANVINFLHRGYGGEAQFLVKNVAFIGAWANALDVLSQSMAGGGFKLAQKNKDPKGRLASQAQFLATAAKLSAATLAYCFLVGDDDEYRNLDDKSKYYNLMIPGTKIMLPMNTTAGFIFKVLPEALYNHYIDSSASTPHDRTRLATSLKHAFLDMIAGPDPIPSGIKPILELLINYNFFTGKPLTPVSLKKDIAEEQYTGSTSELGKAISGMTGNKAIFGDKRLLNPIEADHIVRSLFGSIGSTVMWASNLMGEAALIRPTMTDKQTPIIGPLMRNEVGRNREDLFYDFKARVEQKVQTLNTMESRDKNTREFEREYRKLLSFQKEIAKTQQDLDEINKEIREYETSVRMGPSPDTRANKIIKLQREKHQVLRGIERDRVEAGL